MVRTILRCRVMTFSWYFLLNMWWNWKIKDKKNLQWHNGLALELKKNGRRAKSPSGKQPVVSWHLKCMTIKHLYSAFPCTRASLHISKGKRSLMAPEKCKKVTLSCTSSLSELYSLTSSLIFFSEQGPEVQSTASEPSLPCILCPSGGLQTLLLTAPVMQSEWMSKMRSSQKALQQMACDRDNMNNKQREQSWGKGCI